MNSPPEPTSPPQSIEQTDEQGRVILRASTVNGALHGPLQRVDPLTGSITMECSYEQGLLHGTMRVFDDGGLLAQECPYREGVLHGVLKVYVNGRCVSEQTYVRGVLAGPTATYEESGLVCARLSYAEGQLQGWAQFFHQGAEVRRASYNGGVLHGICQDFDLSGALTQSATYQDNLLHGALVRYWPNGQVMEEQMFKEGKPVSPARRFDQQGRPVEAPTAEPEWPQRLRQMMRGE